MTSEAPTSEKSAETFYQEAFRLVQAEKLEEAQVPAWKGLGQSIQELTGQRLSLIAIKCRMALLLCGVPADTVDDKIDEILISKGSDLRMSRER
ncbi:MAG: hypothetical protein PHH13_01990 [Candidatus Peribacteraceae bacterium]|nr:hypothetical protein [Candidatus Peribacteraceae bacterium]